MIHRNLTTDGDWTFGKGIQDYTREFDAILLNIKTRLQSWKGDCFFSLEDGVDYNNLLDYGTKSLLDSDIKRVILQSEGVLRIVSYQSEIERDTREFSGRASIQTIYGVRDITF